MKKVTLGKIVIVVWMIFIGALIRAVSLEAWKMATEEARHALFAAIFLLATALLLSVLYAVRLDLKEYAERARQEEKEKAEQAAAVKKREKKETANSLKIMGFAWLSVVKWIFIAVFLGLLYVFAPSSWFGPTQEAPPIMYSEFVKNVESGKVGKATTTSLANGTMKIRVTTIDGYRHLTIAPRDANVVTLLRQHNVPFDEDPEKQSHWFTGVLLGWIPMLLFIGIWIFFMRKASGMGGGGFSSSSAFMKSLHHKSDDGGKKTTFADVAGADEAKEELAEIVEFLKDPKKFSKLGGRVPKGALLIGPPGCGKTLLARAVAGEANVPFLQTSGSEFVQMFVGVGASRVRDLFEEGKKQAPCIIFIDEMDAVGKQRGTGLGNGNDEREQTLNQILVAMDGFEQNSGVILLAATNRPDMLDAALRRPGRFDRQVVVDRPDLRGREAILRIHAAGKPFDANVDLISIARGTSGFTGADLASLVNEAALLASRENCSAIGKKHLENAKDKVLMGAERRSIVLSDADKKLTAYHEAGHTVVSRLLKQYVNKVTIIPRGQAMGVTHIQDLKERYGRSKAELIDMIRVTMGGRVAEEIVFGADNISTGAGNDLGKATDLAVKMVCELGMSKLGPRTFGKREEIMFLGKDVAKQKDYSETTALRIDEEVNRLVSEAYQKALELISSHRECLERLAEALLLRETLDASEIDAIINAALDNTAQS